MRNRRSIMIPPTALSQWDMMIHNSFDKYTFTLGSKGNTFTRMDGGEWVQVISNGQNQNTSSFFNSYRYVYTDIKDKVCRLTWNIECSDPDAFTTATGSGNLTFGLYTTQNQTSGNLSYRKGKVDFASLTLGTFLGYHSEEFIPSAVLAGQTVANYFGWNIGFRSSVEGLTINIMQLDFEVHK